MAIVDSHQCNQEADREDENAAAPAKSVGILAKERDKGATKTALRAEFVRISMKCCKHGRKLTYPSHGAAFINPKNSGDHKWITSGSFPLTTSSILNRSLLQDPRVCTVLLAAPLASWQGPFRGLGRTLLENQSSFEDAEMWGHVLTA